MLTEVFGMDWYRVHEEAEQLEHAVSAEFEKKLLEKLGDGDACPHGNRLGLDSPAERRKNGWAPLSELPAGQGAQVQSAYERDRELLEYLDRLGIKPGSRVKMLSHNVDETYTLEVAGAAVPLGRGAASKVWVKSA
jgi:DtxR family Mn-dependent transcriptional regulator